MSKLSEAAFDCSFDYAESIQASKIDRDCLWLAFKEAHEMGFKMGAHWILEEARKRVRNCTWISDDYSSCTVSSHPNGVPLDELQELCEVKK